MERSQVLVAGLGQCGCILANGMKKKNGRYTPIFINSSRGDLKGLTFANDVNTFIYGGADGSGRDRDKAEGFILNDQLRLASFIKKYLQFNYMTVFFSTDGGTGSGTIKEYVKTVKKISPSMVVNLVGVLPNLKEDMLQLKNALSCLADLSEIAELVNDIKFINNNKGTNYEDINRCAIADIDAEYGLLAHSSIGSIDENNLDNVCTSKGYGVVLNMPTNYNDVSEAFVVARENSVFSIPNDLTCTYGAVCVKESDYNVDLLTQSLSADETIYKSYNLKNNIICLGGCEMPYDEINDIENELNEREMHRRSSNRNRGFNFKTNIVKKEKVNTTNQAYDVIDDDDLDALFNPENIL